MRAGDDRFLAQVGGSALDAPALPGPGAVTASPRSRRTRFTSNIVGPIYLFADLLCFAISVPLALAAYKLLIGDRIVASVHLFALATMLCCYLLMHSSRGGLNQPLADLRARDSQPIFDAVVSSLLASALVWQFGMIGHYSRGVSLLYLLSVVACLFLSRPLVARAIRRLADGGSIEQRMVFYGADAQSIATIRRLLQSFNFRHLRFVGVVDDRPKVDGFADLPFLGGFADLADLARRGEVDQVLISASNFSRERLAEIVEGLSSVSVDVSLIPPQAIELAPDYRVRLLGCVPVLTLWQRPFRDINQIVKRAEDVVLSSLVLLLVAPLMALTALLIRLTSAGPILFVQPRIGFNNEVIQVMKFRTMYVDRSDLEGRVTTSRDDPRVTPLGRILRKLSIDELPQLLNVLRGDMSMVGPRPHATHMKVGEHYYQDAVRGYAGRHRVKPGITGLAQVRGLRGEIRTIERAQRRVELDKHYIDHWSVWLDLSILAATVRAVLSDSDAY